MRLTSADFADVLRQALSALRDNRLRTALSIFGIMIGIVAVMVVSAVSSSGREIVFSELQTFGLRSLWVTRDMQDKDPRRAVRSGTGIGNEDVVAITAGCCPAVRRVSPMIMGLAFSVRRGSRYSRPELTGVNADYFDINNETVVEGRSLRGTDEQGKRFVAVIGPDTRRELFGERGEAIGEEIHVGEYRFVVVGVLGSKNRGFLGSIGVGGDGANNRILMPYTVYQRLQGAREIQVLQAEAVDIDLASAAALQITSVLKRHHAGQYAYRSETMAQFIDTANRILWSVWLMGVVAASVSLLVGGTAIMNIMTTSVVERTREIGVRRALGAQRNDILLQFVMEAALISSIGGALGIAAGGAICVLASAFSGVALTPSYTVLLTSVAVSVGIGVVSGYYPARHAARLHPVTALRHE